MMLAQVRYNARIFIVEQLDAYIRVEQIGHENAIRSSKGKLSARTNGSPCHCPKSSK
jgi:hypothetical protein